MGTDPSLLSLHRQGTCASPFSTPQSMTPRAVSCPRSGGTPPKMSGEAGQQVDVPPPRPPAFLTSLLQTWGDTTVSSLGSQLLAVLWHLLKLVFCKRAGALGVRGHLCWPLPSFPDTNCPIKWESCVHIFLPTGSSLCLTLRSPLLSHPPLSLAKSPGLAPHLFACISLVLPRP